jgi:hypothetical protein
VDWSWNKQLNMTNRVVAFGMWPRVGACARATENKATQNHRKRDRGLSYRLEKVLKLGLGHVRSCSGAAWLSAGLITIGHPVGNDE